MAEVHHEIVFFAGRVQGVGFRYTTLQIAKEFEVSGYVKNLADGRVQLEVEGRMPEVIAFIATIEEKMHGFLRKTERTEAKREPKFTGFAIQ
jgi:acylphosphatase